MSESNLIYDLGNEHEWRRVKLSCNLLSNLNYLLFKIFEHINHNLLLQDRYSFIEIADFNCV